MDYHARNRSGDGFLRMPSDGYAFRENGQISKMNLVMLGFHWQLTVLIHSGSLGLFTQCGLFLLSTITFLLGCQ
jgi:hypothetical protein